MARLDYMVVELYVCYSMLSLINKYLSKVYARLFQDGERHLTREAQNLKRA